MIQINSNIKENSNDRAKIKRKKKRKKRKKASGCLNFETLLHYTNDEMFVD